MFRSSSVTAAVSQLKEELGNWDVEVSFNADRLFFASGGLTFQLKVVGTQAQEAGGNFHLLPQDYLVRMPAKVAALVIGKLALNKRIFARKCELHQVPKVEARTFLERYHFMGSTEAAYRYGLYLDKELLAIATFSKGRKMRRLTPDERSFELIRFCTRPGITVSGGLSRLMKAFCETRKAAEIMTYVDRQFSNGSSFVKAGFVFHEQTGPRPFLVNKKSYERISFDGHSYDKSKFYLTSNAGNLKMLFVCREK